jgi:tetratricopeptide (TPR) repeat protein
MPAGELFELIAPVVVVISILLSAWVLASARKRFATAVAFGCAIATLFLPLVVLPLYLAVILLWRKPVRARRWRFLLPLAYAAILLAAIGSVFYHESATVDAHLARAAEAKLIEDHATAIHEYRGALEIENNPHTHKLLAIELANDGQLEEAAKELRLAQQGGEPADCGGFDPRCEAALRKVSALSR